MTGLYYAHSGLRYLVLLAGAIALAHAALALARGTSQGRAGRITTSAYAGLLDLQLLLGLALIVLGGIWYPALMGHLTTMLLAIVVAHGAAVLARGSEDAKRAASIRLAGVGLSLLLVVAGILSIGRSVFGAAPPSFPT